MAQETQYRFEFVDGSAELVRHGSPRYWELIGDGHTPVGELPGSDGISDAFEAYLADRFGAGLDTTDAAVADAVTTPGSATAVALSATYVSTAGSVDPATGLHAIRVIKPSGDTRPGVFEWINNGTGTIFHLLIGPDAVLNDTYAITVGGDNPGNGILLNMKAAGVGLKIEQNPTVTGVDSYGMSVHQENTVAPAAYFYTDVDGAADTVRLQAVAGITNPAQMLLNVYVNTGDNVGGIKAASGHFEWRKEIRSLGAPIRARVLNDAVSDADASHVIHDATGFSMLATAGAPSTWWRGRVKMDGWAMKLTGTEGFGDANGTGTTEQTLIEIAYGAKLGFFGATAINKPSALPANATDLASAQALVNYIKNSVLVPLGLAQ